MTSPSRAKRPITGWKADMPRKETSKASKITAMKAHTNQVAARAIDEITLRGMHALFRTFAWDVTGKVFKKELEYSDSDLGRRPIENLNLFLAPLRCSIAMERKEFRITETEGIKADKSPYGGGSGKAYAPLVITISATRFMDLAKHWHYDIKPMLPEDCHGEWAKRQRAQTPKTKPQR
jgi:hypothetical protein